MQETFGSLLRTIQLAQAEVLEVASDLKVTGSQLSVMSAVVSKPGIDQRGVTAATFIDRSTVASVVTKLVSRGLVVSARDEADGRRDRLTPTPLALDLVYKAAPQLTSGNDAVISPLPTKKREAVVGQLRRIAYADRQEPPERYIIPSPDGLRPQLEVSWGLGRLLRGCLQRYNRIWNEQFGTLVTTVQYLALKALEADREIDQNTLGKIIILDKASLTEMLVRLQRRGLVAKLRDPADGRRRLLQLTPPARVLLSGADQQVPAVEDEFAAPLPQGQRSSFANALRILADANRTRLTTS